MSRFRTDFRRPRGSSGWTLVELLITLGVLVAATGSLVEVMSSSASLTGVMTKQGDLREHSRQVVDVMVRELRWADTSTLVVTQCNGSSKIRFRTARGYAAGAVVWSPTITYEIAASNVDSNHDDHFDEGGLVRIEGGRRTVLSSNVPAGGFSAVLTTDNLQIDLRLSSTNVDRRAVTTTASAAVTLRNRSS
jgi:type II secretory pathway pseudopilin PulG